MSTNVFKLVNGTRIELSTAEHDQLLADNAAGQAAEDARAWLDGRLAAYPSIPEQLDNIFHNGMVAWAGDIQAIKDQFPKPE